VINFIEKLIERFMPERIKAFLGQLPPVIIYGENELPYDVEGLGTYVHEPDLGAYIHEPDLEGDLGTYVHEPDIGNVEEDPFKEDEEEFE